MGKNKLARFAENETFDHVVQPTSNLLGERRLSDARQVERRYFQT